jgi:hypothetical protein
MTRRRGAQWSRRLDRGRSARVRSKSGPRGEAAQSDGLCVNYMVTQHMLRIDSPIPGNHTNLSAG